jgi:hypothetical protein
MRDCAQVTIHTAAGVDHLYASQAHGIPTVVVPRDAAVYRGICFTAELLLLVSPHLTVCKRYSNYHYSKHRATPRQLPPRYTAVHNKDATEQHCTQMSLYVTVNYVSCV